MPYVEVAGVHVHYVELVAGPYAVAGESYGGYLARGLVAAHGARVTGMALVCPMLVADHADRDVPAHRVLHRDAFCEGLPRGTEFDDVTVVQTEETYHRVQDEIVAGIELADVAGLERIQQAGPARSRASRRGRRTTRRCWSSPGARDSSTGYRDAWPLLDHYPHATFAAGSRRAQRPHRAAGALRRARRGVARPGGGPEGLAREVRRCGP